MASNATRKLHSLPDPDWLLKTQYGCGPVQFAGTNDALYERHLLFDNGVDPAGGDGRATGSKRWPGRCATFSRSDGF